MSDIVTIVNTIDYRPIIKSKGFMPNPIAVYGIPSYADSIRNKKVIGTTAHENFWNEQIHYCEHGYDTGGIHIPGRYYYYLNYAYVTTVGRGMHRPDYVDIDLEFFRTVEQAKLQRWGIISPKKRRAGNSEKVSKGIISYGMHFTPEGYAGAVVAGLEDYTNDFRNKFRDLESNLPPEFRLH